MASYADGTVAITCGSNVICGAKTAFLANVKVGDILVIWGLHPYFTVTKVVSDTKLEVDRAISGKNDLSDLAYAISTDFSPILGMPLMTSDGLNNHQLMTRILTTLDRELPKTKNQPSGQF